MFGIDSGDASTQQLPLLVAWLHVAQCIRFTFVFETYGALQSTVNHIPTLPATYI
jgi:hypothetical protein